MKQGSEGGFKDYDGWKTRGAVKDKELAERETRV